jgi:hypothetical protein
LAAFTGVLISSSLAAGVQGVGAPLAPSIMLGFVVGSVATGKILRAESWSQWALSALLVVLGQLGLGLLLGVFQGR